MHQNSYENLNLEEYTLDVEDFFNDYIIHNSTSSCLFPYYLLRKGKARLYRLPWCHEKFFSGHQNIQTSFSDRLYIKRSFFCSDDSFSTGHCIGG